MVFLAVAAAVAAWFGYRWLAERWGREQRYDPMIAAAAARHNLDPALLKALVWRESRFNHHARGGKGEIGLTQLMPRFAVRDWAEANKVPVPPDGLLFDPGLNLEIGAWYLGRASRRWRDYRRASELALCEYNAGRGKAVEWAPPNPADEVIPRIGFRSTRDYVSSIMAKYYHYRGL
jgi:soluble lytic murein transglycosylase